MQRGETSDPKADIQMQLCPWLQTLARLIKETEFGTGDLVIQINTEQSSLLGVRLKQRF